MAMPVSVVIITRNEESNITACIRSAKHLSDDIIVVDAQSGDATAALAEQEGARVITVCWEGYGASRNKGAEQAKYNWIFSLDADERITPGLARSVREINLENSHVYQFKRNNYLGTKRIRFGADGFDKVLRLYHCHQAKWDVTPVHEELTGSFTKIKLPGFIIHYSIKSWEGYKAKLNCYAKLSAHKYFKQNKKAGLVKRFLAPVFNSLKSYIFQLGFLEGKAGLKLAGLMASYTWLKYDHLHRLIRREKEKSGPLPANKPAIFFSAK